MPHMKRYSMPEFWPVPKKGKVFIVRPMPGPHPKEGCIPLQVIVRDVLRYAESQEEAKKILREGKILVDKKPRKNPKFPVGLMDVIEIPEAKKHYRIGVNHRGLTLNEIDEKEANRKVCMINGKTTVKKGMCQLNLHDGRNILLKKDTYRVGDSVEISIPEQNILKHYRFEKGEKATIIAGRNIGVKGKIKDIHGRRNMLEKSVVVLETSGGEIKTLRDYILVGEV